MCVESKETITVVGGESVNTDGSGWLPQLPSRPMSPRSG